MPFLAICHKPFSVVSLILFIWIEFSCIKADDGSISSKTESSPSLSSESSSSAAFALEPDNVRKITVNGTGGGLLNVVAVDIPQNYTNKNYYPNLKYINDSTEIHEENETIAANSAMISGFASKFGKRSARSYHYQYPSKMGTTGSSYTYGKDMRYQKYPSRYMSQNQNTVDRVSDGSGGWSSSWGGNWLNTLKRRTSMMMSPGMPSMSMDKQQQMSIMDEGTQEEPQMSGTFLGGWGAGYGKGQVNRSAVGLLGFLSLLSLIQNVLNQTMTMDGRRRRDVSAVMGDPYDFGYDNSWNGMVKEASLIAPIMLPMLNVVNAAANIEIPVECTLQPICLGNQMLVDNLGQRGKSVGILISETILDTLRNVGKRWRNTDWDIQRKVSRAGRAGRNGKSCMKLYKSCDELFDMPQL